MSQSEIEYWDDRKLVLTVRSLRDKLTEEELEKSPIWHKLTGELLRRRISENPSSSRLNMHAFSWACIAALIAFQIDRGGPWYGVGTAIATFFVTLVVWIGIEVTLDSPAAREAALARELEGAVLIGE